MDRKVSQTVAGGWQVIEIDILRLFWQQPTTTSKLSQGTPSAYKPVYYLFSYMQIDKVKNWFLV